MNHAKSLYPFFCVLAVMFFASFISTRVSASAGDNVTGYAWSGNIGWISMNNTNTGGPKAYGVNIASDGTLSGYAYSEYIGYITFNSADMGVCPVAPCQAKMDTDAACVGGKCYIRGWARACSVFAANCSGALKNPAELGGWDGWIKLNGTTTSGQNYGWWVDSTGTNGGAAGDFHDYAYGAANAGNAADSLTEGVIGWVSANCNEGSSTGTSNCATKSNYKVHTTFSFVPPAPTAKLACDPNFANTCPGGSCDCTAGGVCGGAAWVVYIPNTYCATCNYTVRNLSTGNVINSVWNFAGTDMPHVPNNGLATFTFPVASMTPGIYPLKLTVDDGTHPSSSATNNIDVRNDIAAKPMCSFDDPAVVPAADQVWFNCDDNNFKSKVQNQGKVFLRNDSTGSTGSSAVSGIWTINVDAAAPIIINDGTGNPLTPLNDFFVAGKANKISLAETDNNNTPRSCTISVQNFSGKTLPKWQEVSPIGAMWKNMLAGIFGVINKIGL